MDGVASDYLSMHRRFFEDYKKERMAACPEFAKRFEDKLSLEEVVKGWLHVRYHDEEGFAAFNLIHARKIFSEDVEQLDY